MRALTARRRAGRGFRWTNVSYTLRFDTGALPVADEGWMSETGSAGPTADFPFQWPDPADATLHWTLHAVDTRRPEAMRPLELDIRARFARSLKLSAEVRGLRGGTRAIELNGWQYWCYTAGGEPETPSHLQRRLSFEQLGDRLQERGENYLQALTFPEMRAGNRRLADVDPDTLSAADLAGHLGAALEWYERGWTLHWTRPREDARQRFGALYRELTGEEDASRWRDLLTDEPNKMSDAVEGLAALAASVREQPRLQALLAQESPERVLATLDGVPGGADFRRRLDDFLDPERQGLRSGSSWGVEQNQVLPAWRDHPELVLALVRTYIGMGPASLSAARTAAIARRDQRVAEARDAITESGRREEFDRALGAARRATQAQDDHNYYIDSAVGGLLHRAISAGGRRLAGAGILAQADDVWWLREAQVQAALKGLPAPPEGDQGIPPAGRSRGPPRRGPGGAPGRLAAPGGGAAGPPGLAAFPAPAAHAGRAGPAAPASGVRPGGARRPPARAGPGGYAAQGAARRGGAP